MLTLMMMQTRKPITPPILENSPKQISLCSEWSSNGGFPSTIRRIRSVAPRAFELLHVCTLTLINNVCPPQKKKLQFPAQFVQRPHPYTLKRWPVIKTLVIAPAVAWLTDRRTAGQEGTDGLCCAFPLNHIENSQ